MAAPASVTFTVSVPAWGAQRLRQALDELCQTLVDDNVSVTCQTAEFLALANIGHRGENELVERMLCEGLVENSKSAVSYKLPSVSRMSEAYTTRSMATVASIDELISRPLPNPVHGNLGADIVVLKHDPAAPPGSAFVLHLIQLKRGATAIGYPKKACGATNEGRSSYHIHAKLQRIGEELSATLRTRFELGETAITCAYHLITTATVRATSRELLAKRCVNIVEGDLAFRELMPKRVRDYLQVSTGAS